MWLHEFGHMISWVTNIESKPATPVHCQGNGNQPTHYDVVKELTRLLPMNCWYRILTR